MSKINIRRAVENIKSGTTIYTPVVDMIVNAIQAIESKKEKDGKITVLVERSKQLETDGSTPLVEGFAIVDNGIGFTDENRESFDTLYSVQKMTEGGKGFGRFVCLKYFEDLSVESDYKDSKKFKRRTFRMGKEHDIIIDERVSLSDAKASGSKIRLRTIKHGNFPDRKLDTIATHLVERLLPYFITQDYVCPKIEIAEEDGSNSITLNNYVNNGLSSLIKEIKVPESVFHISGHDFSSRVFKFYNPGNRKSKISLVAHKREVTDTPIHNYVPEFIDEFYDEIHNDDSVTNRNYIIKAYVFGQYLDIHVSLERGGFDFHRDQDLLYAISQNEIEKAASDIAKKAMGDDIKGRQEKKRARVESYVEEQAPWHRETFKELDLSDLPFKASSEEIEITLQTAKFNSEVSIKREVDELLSKSSIEDHKADVTKIVERISGTSKNDLIHYIASRKHVLELFKRSLELNQDGSYSSEGLVHDIIFPRKQDSETTPFKEHNLWLVDERLNFTRYISSDLPLNGPNSARPDLLAYDQRVLFRGDNEPGNPVTIFEFKKPQRDDFVNPSSKEDPVEQIVRYVIQIKDGDFKTPEGRAILISDNTPFYGYVVCDLTQKVVKWLQREKDFKPMPDHLGWFQWYNNINLYVEVISWDKVLKDANMRNMIFFHKLGV
ncbi:hypothetical protein Desti_3468 [Desulfomonile tiedjei DSM 6799]|uniref:ATP-binding protein n=2 Tax=Desulfomonile tiedjei TaxID=2358 RepID=I4C978_DESTA|nr:hypothetical protein Desti_3468 [Desulfomonile tiedjei DSM 6799]